MIELKQVRKAYGGDLIFEDVNMILREGTVTCLIGKNGCGKSTLLKIISGLIPKNSGEIICEHSYRFAYVPEKFSAVNMKAGVYLDYMAAMDGLFPGIERKKALKQYAQEFNMSDSLNKSMKHLSKGTLQKVGVIQALLRRPEVLILDEPLSGQDLSSQRVFIDKIRELKKQGAIIILAAHEENLIYGLSDFVFEIQRKRIIPYEKKKEILYSIVAEHGVTKNKGNVEKVRIQRNSANKSKENNDEKTIIVSEQMLSLEIDRLIKEGWHINKIYENDK